MFGFTWGKNDYFTHEKKKKNLLKKPRKRYILEVDIDYNKELHKNHSKLLFLEKRIKTEKVKKLAPIS